MTEFHRDKQRPDGVRFYCKLCANSELNARVASDPEKYRALAARNTYKHLLRTKYGLTVQEYAAMLAAQGGVCAICKKPETSLNKSGNVKGLAVDHCHSRNKVRKLLCNKCNLGLGAFEDDIARMRLAIQYLEAHM